MTSAGVTGPVPPAVAVGGPLDGRVLAVDEADHVDVVMEDRSRHRYRRGERGRRGDDVVRYAYEGRLD